MQTVYANPVFHRNFPDPFVLKYCGAYWAYCTGVWVDGRWFGVLHSRDLVTWEVRGGAMEPLPGAWPCQWAPEVSYLNGRFYLYYSVGDEATMQIRIAVAADPAGPFIDSGHRLTHEPFAIDPHVFSDDDGKRYLFYATDYLEHSHIGTGTACDQLLDPFTPAGKPVPVTRAQYAWQVYDPQRETKGGVRWHTVEGPFVLKRKGRYVQMFSGGNWQNLSYGVSYALADHPQAPHEWTQVADGEQVLPILRTIPGAVIGPGHNSVVRGPDNMQLYCVYHRWSAAMDARVMAIDPLEWVGERLLVHGPSTTPQVLAMPTVADSFEQDDFGQWELAHGTWSSGAGAAVQHNADDPMPAFARLRGAYAAYVAEVSLQALTPAAAGAYGIAIGDLARLWIEPAALRVVVETRYDDAWQTTISTLPSDFTPTAFHLVHAEVAPGQAFLQLDDGAFQWRLALEPGPAPFMLCTMRMAAAFAGFALTEGWCDLFDAPGAPEQQGWQASAGSTASAPDEAWWISEGVLHAPLVPDAPLLSKGPLPAEYTITINGALTDASQPRGYVLYPALRPDSLGPAVTLVRTAPGWALVCDTTHFLLDERFDPLHFHQVQVSVAGGTMQIAYEGVPLGTLPVVPGATALGLGSAGGGARFEMVRVRADSS